MGIPHLTRHLLPFAEVVWLSNGHNDLESGRNITSVVIDGPALVYHVYYCLLSRMPSVLNSLAAQPTCNEVSIGVTRFLLQLMEFGITIERIYFDGALPVSKRETRLARLEASRRKLESFCNISNRGFKTQSLGRKALKINSNMVFSRRKSQSTGGVPENPFIVQTVIEDLKTRWNRDTLAELAPGTQGILSNSDYHVWADNTEVVPGEADGYCADAARKAGAAVLTGDSDLLVHDLGPFGSVILFNSIECNEASDESEQIRIRATEISPTRVAKKLGIRSLQRFAFEIKNNPHLSLASLVQTCKESVGDLENDVSYRNFLREYASLNDRPTLDRKIQKIDPKVLELRLQFMGLGASSSDRMPVIYLPMLIENHMRQCAWRDGSQIRAIAFSILNLSLPLEDRRDTVLEYSRRGARVYATSIQLYPEHELQPMISFLHQELVSILDRFKEVSCLFSWKVFSLRQILLEKENSSWPSPRHLRRFLDTGHMAEILNWNDIQLNAQMQSILYSLRILRQLLEAAITHLSLVLAILIAPLLRILQTMPPMRHLSHAIPDVLLDNPPSKTSSQEAVQLLLSVRDQRFKRESSGKATRETNSPNQGTISNAEGESSSSENFADANNPYQILGAMG